MPPAITVPCLSYPSSHHTSLFVIIRPTITVHPLSYPSSHRIRPSPMVIRPSQFAICHISLVITAHRPSNYHSSLFLMNESFVKASAVCINSSRSSSHLQCKCKSIPLYHLTTSSVHQIIVLHQLLIMPITHFSTMNAFYVS